MEINIYSKLGLALLLIPGVAHAQLQLTIHPRKTTEIDGRQEAEAAIAAVPGNATLLDGKEWSNQRAATAKDLTDYMPGVITQPRNGNESSRLSVRGSGLAQAFQGRGLLVLQDGIPVNMADGGYEFPMIDPWLVTHAELYPGANALQYGASSFGGAINLITPNGRTANGYELRGEGGSYGTGHGMASYGQAWNTGDLFASVGTFTQDGYRRHNNQDTHRLNANWGWQPNENFSNRFYISHVRSDAEIPGTLTYAEIKSNPRLSNPNNVNGDYRRNLDITRIANKSAWSEGPDRAELNLFYTYRTLDNPVTTYEYEKSNDLGVQAKYSHRYGQSRWLAGFNSYYGMGDEVRYQNVASNPGARILDRKLYASTHEVFGQVEQHLQGKLFGIAGVQGSYAARDIHQGFPAPAEQDEHYFGFSPRIGLRYDIAKAEQLFANISRSFEPPSWAELSGGNSPGFNRLKSQKATTAEIGARGSLRQLNWQAAYYHGWLTNELVNYRFPDNTTATVNARRSKRDGIELSLNGDITERLALRTAYSWSHFTLDKDPLYGNNTLPGVPEHYLRGELLYKHASGISFGPNVEWSPKKSPVDLTNSFYTDRYAIFGARAFWASADERTNLYIEGRNLLNREYIATYNVIPNASGNDGRYFYPGDGRSVYAGFRWKFG